MPWSGATPALGYAPHPVLAVSAAASEEQWECWEHWVSAAGWLLFSTPWPGHAQGWLPSHACLHCSQSVPRRTSSLEPLQRHLGVRLSVCCLGMRRCLPSSQKRPELLTLPNLARHQDGLSAGAAAPRAESHPSPQQRLSGTRLAMTQPGHGCPCCSQGPGRLPVTWSTRPAPPCMGRLPGEHGDSWKRRSRGTRKPGFSSE